MGHKGVRAVFAALLLVIAAVGQPAQAAPLDYPVAEGHFFTQANGKAGEGGLGYLISDADGIPFWTEFQRRGGVSVMGYPISNRFQWRGTTVQAFQKVVLQWQPGASQVNFVNVFDQLDAAGKDGWLRQVRQTPGPAWLPNESSLTWDQIVRGRLAFLDPYPAIKARYFAVPDPMIIYGLPSSKVEDMGTAYVVRLQRAVMQQWKVNTPWAHAGDVTVANGGDIAKETGIFPDGSIAPQPAASPALAMVPAIAPPSGAPVVVIDAGHGGREIGAQYRFPDGFTLLEKNVNLQVALKAADRLRQAGYNVVLTRTTDQQVNAAGRDLNNSHTVTVEDDLQARVDIANAAKATVFVSVHENGLSDHSYRGTEVYYDPDRPFAAKSWQLASVIQRNLLQALSAVGYQSIDRGVKTDRSALGGGHYYLLGPSNRVIARPSNMPAVIGEALFVSNPSDASQLRRPEVIDALAAGYASGIAQYLAANR